MSEYQTIEANGTTLILNEDMALTLFHAVARQFDWKYTVFCPEDIRQGVISYLAVNDQEPYTDEQLDEAVERVMSGRSWRKFLEEWMTEQGFEVLNEIIWGEFPLLEEKEGN